MAVWQSPVRLGDDLLDCLGQFVIPDEPHQPVGIVGIETKSFVAGQRSLVATICGAGL